MRDQLIFFASDVHGSEVCFRKFLNAARLYKPTHLVLGADLSGKVIVPIYRSGSKWEARYRDVDLSLETVAEVEALERRIRAAGAYPYRTSRDEIEAITHDPAGERDLFHRSQLRELQRWIELADQRLAQTGVPCYAMPGNDDVPAVGELLDSSERIVNVDEQLCQIDDDLYMVSLGYSTPTPWRTPREIGEEEYRSRLENLLQKVPQDGRVILNAHDPPHGSGIDDAPRLADDLSVVREPGGEVEWTSVGSHAVREIVQRYQPQLALHGHIHEGRGRYQIGRTVGFNPGSAYQEGVLQGVLIRLRGTGVTDFLFTSG